VQDLLARYWRHGAAHDCQDVRGSQPAAR
jgi:hypothetical protein